MDRSSIIFCVGTLAACVAIAWVAYPLAALDQATIEAWRTPQPAEVLDDVDVGQGFGELPVIELMGYYVENPPAPVAATDAVAPALKFGGC